MTDIRLHPFDAKVMRRWVDGESQDSISRGLGYANNGHVARGIGFIVYKYREAAQEQSGSFCNYNNELFARAIVEVCSLDNNAPQYMRPKPVPYKKRAARDRPVDMGGPRGVWLVWTPEDQAREFVGSMG